MVASKLRNREKKTEMGRDWEEKGIEEGQDKEETKGDYKTDSNDDQWGVQCFA